MSHKVKWYTYLNKEHTQGGGTVLLLNEKFEPGTIIVCQELEYRSYAKFPSYSNFGIYLYSTKNSHRCYYEVIMGPQTPYFDFDALTIGHESAVDPSPVLDTNIGQKTKSSKSRLRSLTSSPQDVELSTSSSQDIEVDNNQFCPKLKPPTIFDPLISGESLTSNQMSNNVNDVIRNRIFKLSGLTDMPLAVADKCIPDANKLCPTLITNIDKSKDKNSATGINTDSGQRNQKLVLSPEEADEAIIALKQAILTTCREIKDSNILIYSSHSDKKRSFHVKIDGWCFPDHLENKAFAQAVMKNYPSKWHQAIDMSMYKTTQQFRVYGSHKWKQDHRVKQFRSDLSSWKLPVIPDDDDHQFGLYLLSSLITNVNSCLPLPSFVVPDVKKQFISSGNSDVELDEKDVDTIIKIALKVSNVTINDFPYKVDNYKGGIISLRRLRPSLCRACQRVHEHENPFIFVVGSERDIYFDCRRNSDGKKTRLGSLGYAVPETIIPGTDIAQIMAMFKQDINVAVSAPVQSIAVPAQTPVKEQVSTASSSNFVLTIPNPANISKLPLKAVPKIKPLTCQQRIDSDLNSKILMMRQLSTMRYQQNQSVLNK